MDPIKYIFEKPALTGRIARWQMLLSEYDIQYVTQKAIKGSVLADYLAHQPIEDYQSMQSEFPNEEILVLEDDNDENTWTLFFDGAWSRSSSYLSYKAIHTYDNKIMF